MSSWSNTTLTTAGETLYAKVTAGDTTLNITKMVVGDGEPESLESLTDLVSPQQELAISYKQVIEDSAQCKLVATVTNSGLETGFYMRELGIYAEDPDDGEILYAVTTDSNPDYLAAEGNNVITQDFAVYIAISNSGDMTAVIDDDAFITVESLTSHNEDDSAHYDMTGATEDEDGKRGFVPAPSAGDVERCLRADGTWAIPEDTTAREAAEAAQAAAEAAQTAAESASSVDLSAYYTSEQTDSAITTAVEAVTTSSLGAIPTTGDAGTVTAYETCDTSATVSQSSAQYSETDEDITVEDGTSGTAWTKIVHCTADSPSVTLGDNWSWLNGEEPDLTSGGLLVCCWCGSAGIASYQAITE